MIKIIGHRGSGRTDNNPFAEGKPPQHTLLSFQKVVEAGADGIEFDIFRSKDGVPVIIHRKGAAELAIGDLTLDEISRISLPDGQHIPTLEEVFVFFAEIDARLPGKKLILNAELKGPGIVTETVSVIEDVARRYPLDRSRIYFDSLEWERLSELRDLDPGARIMPALSTARLFNLAALPPGADKKYDRAVLEELEDFILDKRCCGIDVMTADIRPEMIALAERTNVGFCSYPQGPHPRTAAEGIYRNIGLLDAFSRRNRQPVIFKVEDVDAARSLVEDCSRGLPVSAAKIERVMGMRLT